ncbi:MAG: peptidylprolyl isomerase [Gammaproteobacteria bacterium]|nr:peptidylprolyl isomerase [Gammaproteobacteria bacterium]
MYGVFNKAVLVFVVFATSACADASNNETTRSSSEWRTPQPENLLLMQLDSGTVVIELAPGMAPQNAANIRILANEGYYDGLAIIRSQDNYVVQWGDPDAGSEDEKSTGSAAAGVAAEFYRERDGLAVTVIESTDAYAPEVGFVSGFPIAMDERRAWLTHCYGMVGVSRGMEADSGNGSSLYVVTGHAPRHLDKNITLVGRVLSGIELLSVLPRGTGPLGFYESEQQLTPIRRVQMGDKSSDAAGLQVMRTDSQPFLDYVEARTHRKNEWFVDATGKIELCNLHPPVRKVDL